MKKFVTYFFIIIFSYILPLSSFHASSKLSYSEWIEDSLRIRFQFPRAWVKKIDRTPKNLIAEFSKDNRILLRLDSQIRGKDWDTDRFTEETLDQFVIRYPDLRVINEIRLEEGYQGFDNAHFLVVHYREAGELITNRFIFANKENQYFIIQVKAIRKFYNRYSKESDLFMKSFRYENILNERWRNDSLNYLDPSSNETTIKYIQENLRPTNNNTLQSSKLEFRPEIDEITNNNYSNSNQQPKRWIKDLEPGRNPPQGGVIPVTEEIVEPK